MTLATAHNFGVYVRFGKTSPGGTIWTDIGSLSHAAGFRPPYLKGFLNSNIRNAGLIRLRRGEISSEFTLIPIIVPGLCRLRRGTNRLQALARDMF